MDCRRRDFFEKPKEIDDVKFAFIFFDDETRDFEGKKKHCLESNIDWNKKLFIKFT